MLSSEASAEPGRWNTDRAPFQRGIMDALTESLIETIVWMSSAQCGKTEFILNVVGFFAHYDPSPMLLLQPTLAMATAFSKDRLAPMIRDTPVLSGRVSDPKARDGENTLLYKKFPGGHITLAGANSPASLASRPIRVVLCDEVDRYPVSAGSEGDPVKLAKKRTATFWNRKEILTSTPTVKGASRIEDAFLQSDQRRYFVPCPTCGHFQTFQWSRIKWKTTEDGKHHPETVAYLCESCKAEISERQKFGMLRKGKWIATNPDVKKIAGFHLNELYSPWRRWSEVVEDFLEAKDDPEKLRVWINTSLGETFEVRGDDAPQWKRIYDRRETLRVAVVPARAVLVTAAVDVQKDRLECTIKAWNRRESWVIDHQMLLGDTATDRPWQELDQVLDKEWPHENGKSLRISMMAVDTGYNTTKVYEWVRGKPARQVMAVKGQDTLALPVGQPRLIDVNVRGRKIKRGIRLWSLGVDVLKTEIYGRLKIERPTDTEIAASGFPSGYIHFPMFAEGYFKQVTAEQYVKEKTKRGQIKYVWVKTYPNNEALDCLVYNQAAWYALGCNRWTEEKWTRLELEIGASAGPRPKEPTPPPKNEESSPPPSAKPKPVKASAKRRESSFWK